MTETWWPVLSCGVCPASVGTAEPISGLTVEAAVSGVRRSRHANRAASVVDFAHRGKDSAPLWREATRLIVGGAISYSVLRLPARRTVLSAWIPKPGFAPVSVKRVE